MAFTNVETGTIVQPTYGFWPQLRESISGQAIFIVLALLFVATLKIAGSLNLDVVERNAVSTFIGIISSLALFTAIGMLLIQFYFVAAVDKSAKPLADLWRRMKMVLRHRDTMARGIPMFVSLLLFTYAFTVLKANVNNFIPFSWDTTFDSWDRSLHFGTRPWEWLQPLFGNLPATLLLNINYNLWFIVMQIFWIYFAFHYAPGYQRTRFNLSIFLIWSFGGILCAILLSSAGPCYYNLVVGGESPYAPLMQQLREFNNILPIWAVDTQSMLWRLHEAGSALGGVTAMPSMHNATALLFVLTAWNSSKLLRGLTVAHMVLIFLGSIHLGWHYAVDTYVAWAITLVFWVIAGHLARWWESLPHVQAFNARCTASV